MLESLQLAIILGVAVAVTGPKELHRYARTAGKIAGRAVGYAKAVRGELDHVMDRAQVNEVHKELNETLSQLEAIRHEIRSGFSVLGGHRAFSREVVQKPPPPASAPPPPAEPSPPPPPSPTPVSPARPQQQHQQADIAAVVASTNFNTAVHIHQGPSSSSRGVDLVGMEIRSSMVARTSKLPEMPVNVIPVSAAAANRIPPRRGPPTGSDIILEAVEEMNVASQALEYFRQQDELVPKEEEEATAMK